jgi:hypothetical protein
MEVLSPTFFVAGGKGESHRDRAYVLSGNQIAPAAMRLHFRRPMALAAFFNEKCFSMAEWREETRVRFGFYGSLSACSFVTY